MDAPDPLTERILGCAFAVCNTLGPGFLEKVYENALAMELRLAGTEVEQQFAVDVRYREAVVGHFVADLLVDRKVLVELKAAQSLEDIHIAQCLNYLKATGLKTCLLLNFGKARLEVRRLVL